ncbi:uncharacterized protein LOC143431640 [Xylocopa sonorina]|uniref:uncharacterized protein LOC143431640 n=1 Tax=Xylocopa sonorina TaxID=1818115 RepID=UPI00403B26A1
MSPIQKSKDTNSKRKTSAVGLLRSIYRELGFIILLGYHAVFYVAQFNNRSCLVSTKCFSFKYKCSEFQDSSVRIFDALGGTNFKMLKTYLTIFGINPYQDYRVSNMILIAILTVCSTVCLPLSIRLYNTVREKDYDGIFEDLPQVLVASGSFIKLMNVHSNKSRFRKLFEFVLRGRELLKSDEEIYTLDKIIEQGNKLARLYGITLVTFMTVFLSLPLCNPFLDVILPLNETRPRQHIYRVNYVMFDEFEYFYVVYVHLTCIAIVIVLIIIAVDALYITIIHHACGIFAVCGYRVLKATENNAAEQIGAVMDESRYREFKRCVMLHHEALQFYNTLERSCRNLYLLQMGINMMVISVTAVELVMHLEQPDQAIRTAVFLAGQQFHLYIISLPGQLLLDQSSELSDKIYASNWYEIPVKVQRVLHTMQIRCNRPSILTAAGLYEMKIESFGITVKTCMSYFTMFLSLRE